MAGSVNKVILIGNLGADPEVRHTDTNQVVANLRIATNRKYTNRSGDKVEETEWHSVVMWGRLAEIAENYLSKGRNVYIEGRLRTRKWQDQNGNDRYSTEVIADNMVMLGGKRTEEGATYPSPKSAPEPAKEPAPAKEQAGDDPMPADEPTDDLPF